MRNYRSRAAIHCAIARSSAALAISRRTTLGDGERFAVFACEPE
jgi:hypothetical protein